jgi:hypothetical protein
MRAQANNLMIAREIMYGTQHIPSTQIAVCAFSFGEKWLQLPVDPTAVNNRTVAVGGGYRSRLRMVIDP